jgi:DNA-binding CsgD family transcriptional regulator
VQVRAMGEAVSDPASRSDPASHSAAAASDHAGRVVPLDAALRSTDPRTATMAKVLDLLMLLVPSSVALFYAVNGRLEKYATDPIVAKVEHSRPPDLDDALREYRERYAPRDPFAPRRFADGDTRLATPYDLGQEQVNHSWYARELASRFYVKPIANLYLRAAGRIVAGIALLRDPGLPEISPSEVAVLRKAHALFEHAYTLASQRTPQPAPGDLLRASGLTAREREIAALIARGASNDEISRTLQIARATAKTHVSHVFAKLGVANRHQAQQLINAAHDDSLKEPHAKLSTQRSEQ